MNEYLKYQTFFSSEIFLSSSFPYVIFYPLLCENDQSSHNNNNNNNHNNNHNNSSSNSSRDVENPTRKRPGPSCTSFIFVGLNPSRTPNHIVVLSIIYLQASELCQVEPPCQNKAKSLEWLRLDLPIFHCFLFSQLILCRNRFFYSSHDRSPYHPYVLPSANCHFDAVRYSD